MFDILTLLLAGGLLVDREPTTPDAVEHDIVVARPRNETGGETTNILSRGYHAERFDEISSGRLKTVALTSSEVRAVVGTKGRHCHVEQSTSSVQLLSVETRSVSTSASTTAGDCSLPFAASPLPLLYSSLPLISAALFG